MLNTKLRVIQLRLVLIVLVFCYAMTSCARKETQEASADFESDLLTLKEYFHIPGMAVLIKKDEQVIYENYLGYADLENQVKVDSTTVFPIASVTKTFATVLLMQLVEQGKVGLNDPINHYLENSQLSEDIKIKHLLSHTSEGEPGSFFNYSPRFFLLTNVIEKTSEMPLDELLQTKIISPINLENTVALTNERILDSLKDRLAKPYYFFGEVEEGHYDPGLSAASGISSTVRDLAKFDRALNLNTMLSGDSKAKMFTPFRASDGKPLPYGQGIFTQEFMKKQLKWGYGQEDCFSSLVLKVPEDKLTLILLANNNLMSDPARLINGDITYSLFAMSFLKHFVFDSPEKLTSEDFKNLENLRSKDVAGEHGPFYRQEILANALAASFIGYVDSLEMQKSRELTSFTLSKFPEYKEYANQSLMRLLMVLSTSGNFRDFDSEIEEIGEALLAENPQDPYTNVYLAYHYQKIEDQQKALHHFKSIAEATKLRPFWYSIEAYDYLGDHYKESDPELAKQYFQKIIDIGWNMGGKLDKAKNQLKEL